MVLSIQDTCFGDESEFYKQLDAPGKKRYREKTELLGLCCDPYTTSRDCWKRTPNVWPDVEFQDICAYLIHTPSPYIKEALKAYKSTEAWSYFCAGYVQDVSLLKISSSKCLLSAKVCSCSQQDMPLLIN